MANYVGILDGGDDVWGVRIPDVPGCHGGGATPEAALSDAISALRELATYYVALGIPIPPLRGIAAVIRDKTAEYDPARESLVLVPLLLDRARPVKANISLDAGLLEAIDEEAKRRGLTRSAFLTSAAIDKIESASTHEDKRRGSITGASADTADKASGFADVASVQRPLKRTRRAKRR